MNVLEHVGTASSKEMVTPHTDSMRYNFMRQAVSKLKVGGVFLLVAPSRNSPIDRGHSHYYMPFTYAMMARYGFSLANPFSSKNFLPSPGDVRRWTTLLKSDIPTSLDFILNRSLFGLPAPGSSLLSKLFYILKLHTPACLLPHFHAIIQRTG